MELITTDAMYQIYAVEPHHVQYQSSVRYVTAGHGPDKVAIKILHTMVNYADDGRPPEFQPVAIVLPIKTFKVAVQTFTDVNVCDQSYYIQKPAEEGLSRYVTLRIGDGGEGIYIIAMRINHKSVELSYSAEKKEACTIVLSHAQFLEVIASRTAYEKYVENFINEAKSLIENTPITICPVNSGELLPIRWKIFPHLPNHESQEVLVSDPEDLLAYVKRYVKYHSERDNDF